MTATEQFTQFCTRAIAHHQNKADRFRAALEAFRKPKTEPVAKQVRAPRGAHLGVIRSHLANGVSWPISEISESLGIPRSSVSTVLHKHNRIFFFNHNSKGWSVRNGVSK